MLGCTDAYPSHITNETTTIRGKKKQIGKLSLLNGGRERVGNIASSTSGEVTLGYESLLVPFIGTINL